MKKIYAINGSPRNSANTATILEHALRGAAEAGAETELIHLSKLTFSGCKSCFACKRKEGRNYGKCALRDDLTPILDKLYSADGIIFGTPVYFGGETGLFRNFMERFLFAPFRYDAEHTSLQKKRIPAAFIYTMNVNPSQMEEVRYADRLKPLQAFGGHILNCSPVETLYVCDTFQFDDYAKYDVELFNAEHKQMVRDTQFPEDCRRAAELGHRMVESTL